MPFFDTITNVLDHTITIVPPQTVDDALRTDRYGEPIQGDAEDLLVDCWIRIKKRRVMDSNQRVITYSATVMFGPDTDIKEDWKVLNGTDIEGNILIKEGRVGDLELLQHPEEGIVGKVALILPS